ncbi:MAG: NAD-dependent epimerase/dehydratase family protein [Candidatus Krumholzibacteriota bacterium]
MNRILVTGSTGFVGGRLVSRLLERGEEVRVFVRDPGRLDRSVRDRVEIVVGELRDGAAVDRAVAGCHTILHLAALARAHVKDSRDYFRVNTDAVDTLLKSAAGHSVRRVVHVSSVLARPPERYATAWGISHRSTVYGESKRAAELLVRKYVADGHDAVIVRPSRIYGPGPWNDANGTTRLMAMYLEGKLRFRLADQGVQANYVHVGDVAAGIDLAARKGIRGKAYVLGGENASVAEFLAVLADISGIWRRVFEVPPQAVLPFAFLCALSGKCGGSPSITPAWLNSFLEHRPQDISSSRSDLGYAPRTLNTGISQTLNWLMGIGGGEQNAYRALHRCQKSGA